MLCALLKETERVCQESFSSIYDAVVTLCDNSASLQLKAKTTDTPFDEASCEVNQDLHHVETGKYLEALAFFMKARELVGAFQTLTTTSWKLHAKASTNIALVYHTQHLPAMALAIAEASLAVQSRLSEEEGKFTLE